MSESAILPRVFISCVSDEFKTIRRTVEDTVRHLGYEPVTMENWSAGHGGLLDWLRAQIGSCEGLIQITGLAYGAEPPQPQPAAEGFPERYSYTQFEFLHARAAGIKTWVIQPGPACTRDTPVELLDLQKDPATQKGDPSIPGALERQLELRRLQQDYLQLLKDGNHLRHKPADDKDLQILILTLRDHAAELRHKFGEWQAFVSGHLQRMERKADRLLTRSLIILGLLLLLGLGGWFGWRHLSRAARETRTGIADIKQGQTLDTGRVRAHLVTASEAALKKDLAEAAAIPGDFRKRETLRQADEAAHRHRLSRVEEHVATFAELAAAAGNSPVLDELLRVLDEQGIDQAIAYLDTRRAEILRKVSNKMEEARAQLQPLLTAAQAALAAGKNDEAESLFRDLLHPDHPRWPQARLEFLQLLGSRYQQADKAEANTIYEEILSHSRRLTEDEPDNVNLQWKLASLHSSCGDRAFVNGLWELAARHYADDIAIVAKFAAADPGNPELQESLAISHGNFGAFYEDVPNGLDPAAREYAAALAMHEKLAAADPGNPKWQRELYWGHSYLGNYALRQGRLDEAAPHLAAAFAVWEKVAATDPGNMKWQRDLSISHRRLGDLARQQGRLDEAARQHTAALAIREKLAAADPGKSSWLRDLSISYNRLGDVARDQGRLDAAALHYTTALAIREKLASAYPLSGFRQRGLSIRSSSQRDLSISHHRLGDLALEQGRLDESFRHYAAALAIRKKLAAADAYRTQHLRDLSISHLRLAKLADERGEAKEARRQWQAAHDILNGIRGVLLSPEDRDVLEQLKAKLAIPPGE